MKSGTNLRTTLATLALLMLVVAGCKQLQQLHRPTVLKSADGKFQITIPPGWRKNESLNEQADLAASLAREEMFVIVITERKKDFSDDMTLDKFVDITRSAMIGRLGSPVASPALQVKVSGHSGRQYEVQGVSNSLKVAYLITAVETAEHYHQVISWTLLSRINENQLTLQHITESFREVSPQRIEIAEPAR